MVRGRAAAGEDPQAERRAKREDAHRRRLGETVGGALASWLKDSKLGPPGRWKGGLEGGSARAAVPHIRRFDRVLGKKRLSERLARTPFQWTTPSNGKRARKRVAVLPGDVRIHDIRRTVADALLNRIGVSPWIVDHVVLGHARPKLLRTYVPTLPLGEAREALQRWAHEFGAILRSTQSPPSAQVVE